MAHLGTAEILFYCQILFQAGAAWYAMRAFKIINNSKFWTFLTSAFFLMLIRRGITLYQLETNSFFLFIVGDFILPTLISLLLCVGCYMLYRKTFTHDQYLQALAEKRLTRLRNQYERLKNDAKK